MTLRERSFTRTQYHGKVGDVCGQGSGGCLVQQGEARNACVRVFQGCIGVHDTRLD